MPMRRPAAAIDPVSLIASRSAAFPGPIAIEDPSRIRMRGSKRSFIRASHGGARPRAVILRSFLQPPLVHGIGFGSEDDLTAGAEILQWRQGNFGGRRTRLSEQS